MSEKTVSVPNISCGHCVKTIEREVAELGGVTTVKADVDSRTVAVAWDESETDWAAVEALLDEIGFPASD
ncbi:MAG: heavy-metal-associated domain-containing protein [Gemmatimonadetes bacterium]|nr:heavy-metal-associated domain-containing protein [Gemmatimonadota bacterium]NNF38443.1 heavy-metal-associated domain-containing protein [Gemmatimonadota bacterium]NNK64751.1 heavy-metal-associated domain-containing protein [Gemmatimonadota bacterium]